jgi:uncharacterized hydrophobic protein (TIGR00341 family)
LAERIVEVVVSADHAPEVKATLREFPVLDVWSQAAGPERTIVTAILHVDETEAATDKLQERFGHTDDFRILLLAPQAVLPREEPQQESVIDSPKSSLTFRRVSREELYAELRDASNVSVTHAVMVVLATVVAAVGLARNNTAAVIGAMVLAPLLGPIVALCFGLTLADGRLVASAIRTNLLGLALVLATALVMGLALSVDPSFPEIASRTRLELPDMLLGFAAGAAATLAYTTGLPSVLIGVMVAVALLPPATVLGLLLSEGHVSPALGAGVLLVANITMINLAGMTTFAAQGVEPRRWWKADRAKHNARRVIAIWLGLSVLLAILVLTWGRFEI